MSRKFDPSEPVPIVVAPNDFEAQVVAHALNSEGIRAMVAGAHGLGWAGPGNPLAPVSVLVNRSERMNALRVLRRLRAESKGLPPPEDSPLRAVTESGACVVCSYDMSGLDHETVCPECGTNLAEEESIFTASSSANSVLRSKALRWLFLLLLIAGAVAAFTQ